MTLRIRFILMAAGLVLFAMALHAQVPQMINYQGRVSVGAQSFDGAGQFKFALVNNTGTTYWSNDGTSTAGSQPTGAVTLNVTKGVYSVLLGNTALGNMTAIPSSVFNNNDVRLRIWFNDGTNGFQLLTPDQRIAAVGYAMMAASVADGATPPGGVIAFAGIAAPSGWLLCDGSAVSRVTFAALFTAIGTAHGNGDGATTFNLPDYRGRFLRGLDGSAGRDPDKVNRTAMASGGLSGNSVGSVQLDDIKNHNHSIAYLSVATNAGVGLNLATPDTAQPRQDNGIFSSGGSPGAETRPKNAYVNYIIKY